jgi:hypothetical protein
MGEDSLQPIHGFKSLETHHCISGSLRHIYEFHGYTISEDLLFGLGSGLGFVYWHMKGTDPFYGGRANVGRGKEEGLELTAARRTGVAAAAHTTSSAAKSEKALLELLGAGEPVYVFVDMGFLTYLNLPEGYHFGAHAVVIGGYDAAKGRVLVADRDTVLHAISLDELGRARGSKFKPFPPGNRWLTFNFQGMREPRPAEVREAIQEVAAGMVQPPISNLGVKGIRTAAKRTAKWTRIMDEEQVRRSCFNVYIFIDAKGGTGGGIFRYMYARFLKQAAELCGDEKLSAAGDDLHQVGNIWQDVARGFQAACKADDLEEGILKAIEPLPEIAEREQAIWNRLLDITQDA